MILKIKRLENGIDLELPSYSSSGAAGMDIVSAENIAIKKGMRHAVSTGFALSIPEGFEIQIRPRSGLALKHGISVLNSPGTIDCDYRGEVKIIIANFGDTDFEIKRGDRIAQMVLSEVPKINLELVDDLDDTIRGYNGFGSTGV